MKPLNYQSIIENKVLNYYSLTSYFNFFVSSLQPQKFFEIPIYYIDKKVVSYLLPFTSIIYDLEGERLSSDINFQLTCCDRVLTFSTYSSLFSSPVREIREGPTFFKENLWHGDVIELFLVDTSTGNYYEFHLSPDGFFWGKNFTGYRKAGEDIIDLKYDHYEDIFSLTIPCDKIKDFDSGTFSSAVCGYINKANRKRLFSTSPNKNSPPDFHRDNNFLPIKRIKI